MITNSPHLTDDPLKCSTSHDFSFPAPEKLSYDNYLVGVKQLTGQAVGMNFAFSDGSISELACSLEEETDFTEVSIGAGDQIRKVTVWGSEDDHMLRGLKLYGPDDQCLLTAGECIDKPWTISRTFSLEPGERIIGVKSLLEPYSSPSHYDPVFIIGRLDK